MFTGLSAEGSRVQLQFGYEGSSTEVPLTHSW